MEAVWVGEELVILRGPACADPARAARAIQKACLPGVVEAAAAWDSVGVYVGPGFRMESLEQVLEGPQASAGSGQLHVIPVCYEMGEDLEEAARLCGMTPQELVQAHSAPPYVCRAVGFCPGFPYLGPLAPPLDRLPRRPSPRPAVPAGSVAAAAGQTGVYPLERPGGWMLLGRTPLAIVDLDEGWLPIQAGDTVQFTPISASDHASLAGRRLGEAP